MFLAVTVLTVKDFYLLVRDRRALSHFWDLAVPPGGMAIDDPDGPSARIEVRGADGIPASS